MHAAETEAHCRHNNACAKLWQTWRTLAPEFSPIAVMWERTLLAASTEVALQKQARAAIYFGTLCWLEKVWHAVWVCCRCQDTAGTLDKGRLLPNSAVVRMSPPPIQFVDAELPLHSHRHRVGDWGYVLTNSAVVQGTQKPYTHILVTKGMCADDCLAAFASPKQCTQEFTYGFGTRPEASGSPQNAPTASNHNAPARRHNFSHPNTQPCNQRPGLQKKTITYSPELQLPQLAVNCTYSRCLHLCLGAQGSVGGPESPQRARPASAGEREE